MRLVPGPGGGLGGALALAELAAPPPPPVSSTTSGVGIRVGASVLFTWARGESCHNRAGERRRSCVPGRPPRSTAPSPRCRGFDGLTGNGGAPQRPPVGRVGNCSAPGAALGTRGILIRPSDVNEGGIFGGQADALDNV